MFHRICMHFICGNGVYLDIVLLQQQTHKRLPPAVQVRSQAVPAKAASGWASTADTSVADVTYKQVCP